VELIASYVTDQQTGGFVDGLTTKLKVLKGRWYEPQHVVRLGERLTLDFEGYRPFSLACYPLHLGAPTATPGEPNYARMSVRLVGT